ncbi:MAG: acetyl-CoA carboxylase carboxyltransferase subunit alpha [Lachnospiraceae bacterium]|nr:acetyl-CoA carboxylase carboxyltransferase subunit alpha [Lachnospiraceae bacterium]
MIRNILEQAKKVDAKLSAISSSAKKHTLMLTRATLDPSIEPEDDSSFEEIPALLEEERKEILHLQGLKSDLLEQCRNLTPADRVVLARLSNRPHITDFIPALFTDFFEQKGDHLYDEDPSIYGGIALYHKIPVTVLGHRKGSSVEENLSCRFGMPCPEGYRKAMRLMAQAEKFARPIITFIDTPGAYPGMEAEEHGQGEAIARSLAFMSHLSVPVIAVVTGEGNSGGALALSVCNRMLMLENAVYSVLSPEGFASILWKDASRHEEACELMKMTSYDLYENGIVDEVIPEPLGGAQTDPTSIYRSIDEAIYRHLKALLKMSPKEVRADRHKKFRKL